MPKGKKKGKYEHRRTEPAIVDDDVDLDSINDNMSETSGQSDLRSVQEEAGYKCYTIKEKRLYKGVLLPVIQSQNDNPKNMDNNTTDDVKDRKWICGVKHFMDHRHLSEKKKIKMASVMTKIDKDRVAMYEHLLKRDDNELKENEAQEKLEEKVLETVEALNARAAGARAEALQALRAALQRRPLGHVLAAHRATLADHVARAVRRGRDAERRAAAALAPLLALQIGEEGVEEFVSEVRQALTFTATDRAASLEARTESCSSLAALCFMLEEDITEILEVMTIFETIFSGSYPKGDGSIKVSGSAVEEGSWHAAALEGWALLLSLAEEAHAAALTEHARLEALLGACALEVRLAAGGALAVAHEAAPAARPRLELALPALAALATDSRKHRAKRDRKVQRATFRDIVRYIEEGDVPSLTTGAIVCDTWAARAAYVSLAGALGAGLHALAPHVPALRRALHLPPAPAAAHLAVPAPRLNKLQRHLQNAAAGKARTLARNKNRDKRSAALAV